MLELLSILLLVASIMVGMGFFHFKPQGHLIHLVPYLLLLMSQALFTAEGPGFDLNVFLGAVLLVALAHAFGMIAGGYNKYRE